jgi:hypothetical protein
MNSGDEIVVNKLRADQKKIQEELEQIRKPIAQLEADLQSIQGALAFYQRKATAPSKLAELQEVLTEAMATIPMARLKGLSHEAAVVAIAKYNGGTVRTQEAKRLMIKAGIMSPTKNATNMAHNAIQRSEKFDWVSPGEYRLKEAKPSQELELSQENLNRAFATGEKVPYKTV